MLWSPPPAESSWGGSTARMVVYSCHPSLILYPHLRVIEHVPCILYVELVAACIHPCTVASHGSRGLPLAERWTLTAPITERPLITVMTVPTRRARRAYIAVDSQAGVVAMLMTSTVLASVTVSRKTGSGRIYIYIYIYKAYIGKRK